MILLADEGPLDCDDVPEWLLSMAALHVQPGDIIVLRVAGRVSDHGLRILRKTMEEIWPHNKCVILEEGMDIGVVRADNNAD